MMKNILIVGYFKSFLKQLCCLMLVFIYIYIYIYILRERERDKSFIEENPKPGLTLSHPHGGGSGLEFLSLSLGLFPFLAEFGILDMKCYPAADGIQLYITNYHPGVTVSLQH